jgi:Protein of unknown function (DUF3352)
MMKKILVALLILIIVGAGIGIYWFFFYSPRDYAEKILPENTVAYVLFTGADRLNDKGPETLLWKKIATSPRKQLYLHQLDRMMSFTESVIGVDPRPLLSQFTKDVALGIVPVSSTRQAGVLIGYVRKEKQTREFVELKLDPGLKRRFPDLRKSTERYANSEYYKYSSKNFRSEISPCYTVMDHHLILTSSEPVMKALLDVSAKRLTSFRRNKMFDQSKGDVHFKDGILFYVNGPGLLDLVHNRLPDKVQMYWPPFLKISGLEAVRGFAYCIDFQGDGFREEGFVSVDKKREGFAKVYMSQKPQKLSGMNFLSSNSQAAGAGTIPDGMVAWKEIQTQVETVLSSPQFSQLRGVFDLLSTFFNFNFQRDLVEPLGNQFSFSYDLPEGKTDPKWTRYFVALEIKKPDRFRQVMENVVHLAQQRGFARRSELYQGKTMQIIQVNAGSMSASPAYWFEGSWFFFGTHQDYVKQTIDAIKNKQNLPSLSDYQKVMKDFPEEVNGISYTNTRATLQRYAAALQNQPNLREYGLLEELNDLSKSLFGSGSYTLIEKDGIRYRAYSSIPTSFLFLPAVLRALK